MEIWMDLKNFWYNTYFALELKTRRSQNPLVFIFQFLCQIIPHRIVCDPLYPESCDHWRNSENFNHYREYPYFHAALILLWHGISSWQIYVLIVTNEYLFQKTWISRILKQFKRSKNFCRCSESQQSRSESFIGIWDIHFFGHFGDFFIIVVVTWDNTSVLWHVFYYDPIPFYCNTF